MPTIKDVARLAGVSISTVSNYLNNKPNLSAETAVRIQAAIDCLHYVAQDSAREVKRGCIDDVGVILPNISEPYLEKLMAGVKGFLSQNGRNIQLMLTDGSAINESRMLKNLIGKKATGIILYTCQPENSRIFETLACSGIPYVLLDRRPEDLDCDFVAVDCRETFFRITKSLLERGFTRIGLACGHEMFQENQQAVEGYLHAFRLLGIQADPSYICCNTASREYGFRAGIRLLELCSDESLAILTTSYHLAEGIRYAANFHHKKVGRDVYILSTGDSIDDVFYDDSAIHKTSRNAFAIGESAARLLMTHVKAPLSTDKRQIIFRDEFVLDEDIRPQKLPPVVCGWEDEIQALVLDDEMALGGLPQLLVNFYAREHINVRMKTVRTSMAFDYINEYLKSDRTDIDVILFDLPWLAYFASCGYLLDIGECLNRMPIDLSKYLPGAVDCMGKFEGRTYALPYLVSTQLLFYRKDLLEDKVLANQMEKRFVMSLKVPDSWFRFNAIARFFTREFNKDSPVEYGHSMALSNPSLLTCDLMPRIWECGGSLANSYNQLDFNSQANRKGIRNLLEAVLYSAPDAVQKRPANAVDDFLEGRTAMLYTFQNFAAELANRLKCCSINDVGYAPLPGNSTLSGWSLGIPRKSKHPESAFRFMRWATSTDVAIPHAILGGQSPCLSVYRNYDLISLYPWLPMAQQEFANARPRFPVTMGEMVLNPDEIDKCLYDAILPMVAQASDGHAADMATIGKALSRLRI